jgi:hypothetical protein
MRNLHVGHVVVQIVCQWGMSAVSYCIQRHCIRSYCKHIKHPQKPPGHDSGYKTHTYAHLTNNGCVCAICCTLRSYCTHIVLLVPYCTRTKTAFPPVCARRKLVAYVPRACAHAVVAHACVVYIEWFVQVIYDL